ncbi:PTS system, fructose-specific IIA component [Williamsoniiplasma luminosum]|uniref:PTS system, fructose-specific IIA component n=1 Tax=Williamsoniiplasma luminosum TaxID=214888 RepID=A0A2K8NTP9_9MOLU|nr:fructose PTS transporter subunit IIA [Williamsoniiplasma luminosum]ATZ17134.1 PTS system, fructose-specific IIA component [Williamsoniiplasma luminosum]
MEKLFNESFVFLDTKIKDINDLFNTFSQIALDNKICHDKNLLIKEFKNRESLSSTGLEDGIAIPHARTNAVDKAAIFFIRLEKGIEWETFDKSNVNIIIMLFIPETQGNYLDILANISQKLMQENFRDELKAAKTKKKVIELLSSNNLKETEIQEISDPEINVEQKLIVGVSACPTGVAHTYMTRKALIKAANKLGYAIKIETQGQKGIENHLSDEDIEKASAIILATDISIDDDRFNGKKVYQSSTKKALMNPEQELKNALKTENTLDKGFTIDKKKIKKEKQSWVQHLLSGISYMIPFIVFAGLVSAILAGIANAAHLTISDGAKPDASGTLKFMYTLNEIANIGFSVMMAIAGAYIANSISGRAGIAPAFILTMLGNNPKLVWQGYFENVMVPSQNVPNTLVSINEVMQPLNIFGAVMFGLAVGYTIKWINTKWKIHNVIQPIMPIIIIPVFLTLIFAIIFIFTIGPVIGITIGYLYQGLYIVETSSVGMPIVGLLLGLLAGVDMGGPINKIASFGATAMMSVDGGSAMGASAAAFAVAPLGAGLATFIFRKTFKDDKEKGINATILGVMGVSESAIPYAIKYKWAAIIPNIICSGIAGMFAGIFLVQGHVGAWGGPIIAIFAGVTTSSGSFVGIPLYLAAIGIGVACHIILFRILVELQIKGKLTKNDFKSIFSKKKKSEKNRKIEKI